MDAGGITAVETPGFCLALTTTTHGTFLAAFRGGDICEMAQKWEKVCHVPMSQEGESWSFLAEEAGAIAFATTPKPRLVAKGSSAIDYSTVYDSAQTLWLFEGGILRQIAWPPVALTLAPTRRP